MFKKLKIKLMLLNLAVAGIILLGISAIAFVLISDNIHGQSEQVLNVVTNNFAIQQSSAEQLGPNFILKSTAGIYPYLIIAIDAENKVLVQASFQGPRTAASKNADEKMGFSIGLDKRQLDEAVQIILTDDAGINEVASKLPKDSLKKAVTVLRQKNDIMDLGNNLSYRYTTVYSNGYIFAIMQDMESEKTLLANVAITLGICVLAGLLFMIFGGLFLAERSLRPIRVSWKKQRDFVADASHELRTPLAAIMGNIDVVMDDPQSTVQDKQLYCQGISEEAKRMSLLVDGLLMLARADSDAIVLQSGTVDIAGLCRDAVSLMQPVAAKKEIGIHINIMQAPLVSGDAGRLKQVVLQLLDNALKYTPGGGSVEVGICEAKDKAVIRVADNGIGIAKEHMGKVFERFYRVDSSREREVGGHGLGLSIAKFIVEQHGGSIAVTSEEGKGSMFTITLPALKCIQ